MDVPRPPSPGTFYLTLLREGQQVEKSHVDAGERVEHSIDSLCGCFRWCTLRTLLPFPKFEDLSLEGRSPLAGEQNFRGRASRGHDVADESMQEQQVQLQTVQGSGMDRENDGTFRCGGRLP